MLPEQVLAVMENGAMSTMASRLSAAEFMTFATGGAELTRRISGTEGRAAGSVLYFCAGRLPLASAVRGEVLEWPNRAAC